MVGDSNWSGLVVGQRADDAEQTIVSVLIAQAPQGGSKPAQVLADDQRKYWIKPFDNPQGDRVPITEQIVARCGHLIGAPTCDVALLRIPAELEGYSFAPGRILSACIMHGSLDVENVDLERQLSHRTRDDNSVRHAYIHALYDWCWGDDHQWL